MSNSDLEQQITILSVERCSVQERLVQLQNEIAVEKLAREESQVAYGIAEEECARESSRLTDLHHAELQLVRSELIKTRSSLNRLTVKLTHMRKTPFGY